MGCKVIQIKDMGVHQLIVVSTLLWLLTGCAIVPMAIEYPATVASLGITAVTNKGPADHAISYVINEDCNVINLVKQDKPYCQDNKIPVAIAKPNKTYSDDAIITANNIFSQRRSSTK